MKPMIVIYAPMIKYYNTVLPIEKVIDSINLILKIVSNVPLFINVLTIRSIKK